jgi:hypothetical protein
MNRSAYFHFSKINNATIKEDLLREGKDAGLGALQSAVAAKVIGRAHICSQQTCLIIFLYSHCNITMTVEVIE